MDEKCRWLGQLLRHLQYAGNRFVAGEDHAAKEIAVPEDVMDILRSLFPGYDAAVFFDLETTGLDPLKDKITQISAVSILMQESKIKLFNAYIRLEEGEHIPKKIRELTGLSDELLGKIGVSKEQALLSFGQYLKEASILLAAHNAQFDLCFLLEALNRHPETCKDVLSIVKKASYFDTLTVYKDRQPSPHNLTAALTHYELDFQSHHHALEDAGGAFALACFMGLEKRNLDEYINKIGINPKYGLIGYEIGGVTYFRQEGNPVPEEKIVAAARDR